MRVSTLCVLFLIAPAMQAQLISGYRITESSTSPTVQRSETTYFAGDRERRETEMSFRQQMPDGSTQTQNIPRIAYIERCDLGQTYTVNLDAAEYTSYPYPPKGITPEQIAAMRVAQPGPMHTEKTLRIETTTVDTGERRDFYGRTARHVITTRKQIPLEASHSSAQETVTDGWYIDLDRSLSYWPKPIAGAQYRSYGYVNAANAAPEIPEFVDIGKPETGFAMQQMQTTNSTFSLPDGTSRQIDSKSEVEVTEFQEGPLDPGLFEVPSEFKKVEQLPTSVLSVAVQRPPSAWDQFWSEVANKLGGKN